MLPPNPVFSETATSSLERALLAREGDFLPETGSWADPAALIDELGRLGRTGRGIAPDVLANYERVLATPQVQFRGRAGTDRGQAAHEALKQAIASIPDDLDRLIAEAVLAARPELEGLSVEDRKGQVPCSRDTYKRRRPEVMKQLADALLTAPADTLEGNVGKLVPAQYAGVIADLGCVVVDAARLHYGLLACLFAQGTDRTMRPESVANEGPFPVEEASRIEEIFRAFPTRRAWGRLFEGVYASYYDLIISGMSCFAEGAHAKRAEVENYLPSFVFESMEAALSGIYSGLPVEAYYCRELCKHNHGTHQGIGHQRGFHRRARNNWHRWAAETFAPERIDPGPIESVASLCAACALLGLDYVEPPQPFVDGAMEAFDLLGDFFGIDPHASITDEIGSIAELAVEDFAGREVFWQPGSSSYTRLVGIENQVRHHVKQLSRAGGID